MECVLRVQGRAFDVDGFLATSPWRPNPIYRRGDGRRIRIHGPQHHEYSGFVLGIPGSDSPGEAFQDQVAAVLAFLTNSRAEFERLRDYPAIEDRILDFAVPLAEDEPMRSSRIPVDLVRAAAELRLALELTVYAVSDSVH